MVHCGGHFGTHQNLDQTRTPTGAALASGRRSSPLTAIAGSSADSPSPMLLRQLVQPLARPPPGECGVDIVAQPPGKRLQNILLLSGGEKALTALSLLIAVFRYQPSPFCILDEVDAPLDEANVGRFNKMLREMGGETQFIVVTHNRRTMEMGSVLYGVTMQEPGVSKLVSVRWDEAPEQAMAKTNAA